MTKRLPSKPPVLPGFTFIRPLGTGGFSDVFLYEQDFPRREVAIKVMLNGEAGSDILRMFANEADALARLSSHPAILSVYGASRAADGRPYLVMENCPDSYATSFREFVLSVGEVLDVGVRLAGALETVHRAGILHRDVKPSNILRTATGAPVLSDFGVASTRFFSVDDDRVAMSIPWGAPEIVSEDAVGSIASDIWSLGATTYSLLAGKSPFEREGIGANVPEKLVRRIRKAHYTTTGRDDVPDSLETILARSMSLHPSSRQSSAKAFGEQLQAVQRELGFAVTELEILGEDSVRESVQNIAHSGSAQSRIPQHPTVGYERRSAVRAQSERGALGSQRRRDTDAPDAAGLRDGIPQSQKPRSKTPRLNSALAIGLALSGAVALVVAVVLVTVGR